MKKLHYLLTGFLFMVLVILIPMNLIAADVNREWLYKKGVVKRIMVWKVNVEKEQGEIKRVSMHVYITIRRSDGMERVFVGAEAIKVWSKRADEIVETKAEIYAIAVADCPYGDEQVGSNEVWSVGINDRRHRPVEEFVTPHELDILNKVMFKSIMPEVLSGKYRGSVAIKLGGRR